jgi:SAM-dependent methyltransferase
MTTVPLTEAALEQAVIAMYTDVATVPDQEFHFWSGRTAAERFGYRLEWLEGAPRQAIDSFAGVGNPHRHAAIDAGDVVVDLGSGAGLDSFIGALRSGSSGRAIGVDLNDTMLAKARELAQLHGVRHAEFRKGRIEDAPVDPDSADWVISNGVINLSFRKKKVMAEAFRVLRPGGRAALTDVVSESLIPESIANDPNLWAS